MRIERWIQGSMHAFHMVHFTGAYNLLEFESDFANQSSHQQIDGIQYIMCTKTNYITKLVGEPMQEWMGEKVWASSLEDTDQLS